jgi:glycosyltransferase involved in cell wall biosynthesis
VTDDPTVVIWRSCLLFGSETFVRDQGNALTRWRPAFLGAVKVDSVLAADTDVIAFADHPRGFLALRLTGGSRRLRAALAGLRPSVVHAHFGGDGWLVSRTAAQLGVPLVVTLHGRDVMRQPRVPGVRGARYRRNLRTAFDRAAVILAVSEVIRERAVELGADPAKVRVHHTGVPLPAVPPPVDKEWDVVFVGRFVEKKGIDDLIDALHPATRALFVGDGPLWASMRARAVRRGLDATFVGQQEPAAVRRHLAASKVLAAPSRTAADGDAEGLPSTVLEAASLGLPTVATHHSGIPEAVVHGETGLLCAERDTSALAADIARLLADDALRDRLGAAARRHVEAHFDLAKQTALLEDVYDAVRSG